MIMCIVFSIHSICETILKLNKWDILHVWDNCGANSKFSKSKHIFLVIYWRSPFLTTSLKSLLCFICTLNEWLKHHQKGLTLEQLTVSFKENSYSSWTLSQIENLSFKDLLGFDLLVIIIFYTYGKTSQN